MDEQTKDEQVKERQAKERQAKEDLKKGGQHLLHGVEDAADVVGHTVVGAVQGAADGVQGASAATKSREDQAKD
jgi:hypothetical protein